MHNFLLRELPEKLKALPDLALDLRWTWSHAGDELWRRISPDLWERSQNPWVILQNVSGQELQAFADDLQFMAEFDRLVAVHQQYFSEPAWYQLTYPEDGLKGVAYFSLEFGLGEALPFYAGGLGILAGDTLKAASDLGVPVVGVGLLYNTGYFRQIVDAAGRQSETYPYNDSTSLPIQPVTTTSGNLQHVALDFPGRTLQLRIWQVRVGRVTLYLLDSNDPLNSPVDRGITSTLYGGGSEQRLMQEIVLGIGGWLAIAALGMPINVCHLNEGHAAFVILERARRCMRAHKLSFWEALWATRAGNVFTTHTPVAAGFDTYSPALIQKYFPYFRAYLAQLGLSLSELLALGRRDPHDDNEPFNMAYLAMRGCGAANGVSQLHGAVSRRIFADLYPRWPQPDIPVTHVTNGVHVPSWDSPWADTLWTEACGKGRWCGETEPLTHAIQALSDETLWQFRAEERHDLVLYARDRLATQLGQRGAEPEAVSHVAQTLNPNALTLGFARRFTTYKRPNLLLHDPARLERLLTNARCPVQLIVAGKAHPEDEPGKRLVQSWIEFLKRPAVRQHAVFLEDYDIALAQQLVQGVDVWINTPRRPWEACGTSGMKVLVNGGLNLSELEGWWAEAYTSDVGWALGDGHEHAESDWDAREAEELYRLLEDEIVPAFYDRDAHGVPRGWVARMRASMARLAPQFSTNRMMREYVERLYLPAAAAYVRRTTSNSALAKELQQWWIHLRTVWHEVHIGHLEVGQDGEHWVFTTQVYLAEIDPKWVCVELYAEPIADEAPLRLRMDRIASIPGAINGYCYAGRVPATRPASHFTPRIIPYHPEAQVPMEATLIYWYG
ncbi:MAG: alpha-glucan family phosphorylase [Candidatus Binatia bacterium]